MTGTAIEYKIKTHEPLSSSHIPVDFCALGFGMCRKAVVEVIREKRRGSYLLFAKQSGLRQAFRLDQICFRESSGIHQA